MTKTSPLNLERYYVTSLEVKANLGLLTTLVAPVTVIAEGDLQIENKILGHQDDPTKMLCELKVRTLPSSASGPYQFSITVVGLFQIALEVPTAQRDQLIALAEPTLLYSVAREVILNQTARGPFPPALLPVVSFSADAPQVSSNAVPRVPQGAAQ